jgi:anti-sigma factor ChrR (cupin superfamily)
VKLNADFSVPAWAVLDELPWQPSPDGSVERRMLDRIGDEVARATTVVRYPPDSHFPAHRHDLGEEFLVMEGVFSDEHGDYPPGTYVRNPPGSSHSPFSKPGCVLFVKLRQFARDDLRQVSVDTRAATWSDTGASLSWLALHRHGDEVVSMARLEPGAALTDETWPGGAEILVLEGGIEDGERRYPANSWLRLPPGSRRHLTSETGALCYLKQGHLSPAVDQ